MKVKEKTMQRIRYAVVILIGAALVSILPFSTAVHAQTGARVTFAITPAIFRAGQPATAELSVTSVTTTPLTLSLGNTFTFLLDSSVGAVMSLATPISVSSGSLVAGDFSVTFGANHNQVILTYNGQSKTFAFGDCLTVKIGVMAGPQAGTFKLSLSSQFVSAINGNLPFTTVSIVDFANPGLASVIHDQSLTGDGTPPTPLGIAPGGVTNADIALGAVTAPDIAAGQVVKSLNGLEDAVSILAGTNVTVTPGAGTLTVSAPNLLSSVAHDSTLTGNGTIGSPIGVAPQGIGTTQLANNSVTSAKIAPGQVGTTQLATGAVTTAQLANSAVTTAQLADSSVTAGKIVSGQVVKTLNGFTDGVVLATDANLQIFTEAILPTGGILHLSAPNMLTSIAHDASLTGNGTSGSPLSVATAAAAPSQQPVAFSAAFSVTDGTISTTGCDACAALISVYTVPQGQLLVIQQVIATMENVIATQQHGSAFIIIKNGTGTTTLPIIITEQAQYGDLNVVGTTQPTNSFGGSQPVTIYVPAGQTVTFGGSKGNAHGQADFSFFFYGYLVPAP